MLILRLGIVVKNPQPHFCGEDLQRIARPLGNAQKINHKASTVNLKC